MYQSFEDRFDFDRTIYTDNDDIVNILIAFNKRRRLAQNSIDKVLINVKGQIVFDLKDKLNPTYDIKLNAI